MKAGNCFRISFSSSWLGTSVVVVEHDWRLHIRLPKIDTESPKEWNGTKSATLDCFMTGVGGCEPVMRVVSVDKKELEKTLILESGLHFLDGGWPITSWIFLNNIFCYFSLKLTQRLVAISSFSFSITTWSRQRVDSHFSLWVKWPLGENYHFCLSMLPLARMGCKSWGLAKVPSIIFSYKVFK